MAPCSKSSNSEARPDCLENSMTAAICNKESVRGHDHDHPGSVGEKLVRNKERIDHAAFLHMQCDELTLRRSSLWYQTLRQKLWQVYNDDTYVIRDLIPRILAHNMR
eukprot:4182894-Amphidinium_carterae.1